MTSSPNPGAAPGFGRRPLGTGSLGLSLAIHVIAIGAMFWVPSLQPDTTPYLTVQLRVVSTPPPQGSAP